MAPTATASGRLSDLAREVRLPDAITATGWPAVVRRCADWGDAFDEWQDGAGRAILAKREDGRYAATIGGVVLSIPRQVAKTFLVSRIVFALCSLYPGTTVLWTAHHTRTSGQTFRSMQAFARRVKVAPHVAVVRATNGEQEIGFRNGSRILFGAREHGFGRGFAAVDVIVLDEAQILTAKALEDMIPAANQARAASGALVFYMGTPPRPGIDPGEVFTAKRADALAGDPDTLYIEFSADPDADPDDREQWRVANPSYPHRTPLESMLRMRKNLPSDEAWLREALGIWAPEGVSSVIDQTLWSALLDEHSVAVDDLALGIDVNPERSSASIAVAGRRADGLFHVELVEQRRGAAWVPAYVADIASRRKLRAVVVDGMSPAASLVNDLAARKVQVSVTDARAMAYACGAFYDRVQVGTLRHIGQHQLDYALSMAGKRPLLDGAWGWNRKHSGSDITAIVAVTLALWGVESGKVKRPRKGRTGGRKVVVGA